MLLTHLRFACLLAGLLAALAACAQTVPTFDYVASAGTPLGETSPLSALDPAGNTFVAGYFQSPIQLGAFTLSPYGTPEVFVAKFDPAGNCLWATQTSGLSSKMVLALATDPFGNAYLAGSTNGPNAGFGSLPFATGPAAAAYHFAAKINGSGQWRWVRAVAGGQDGLLSALAVDAQGSAYLAGRYSTPTVQFGAHTLTNPGPGPSSMAYVARLDSTGTWQWAVNGANSASFASLALDGQGQVAVAGSCTGTTQLGTLSPLNSAGQEDVLVAGLLAASGTWAWACRAGGNDEDYATSLTYARRWLVGGSFASTNAQFGTLTRSPTAGLADVFVARVAAPGTFEWVTTGGSPGDDKATTLTADNSGNTYVGGRFTSPLATFGTTTLIGLGDLDVFIAKLDSTGQYSWAVAAGSRHNDILYSLSLAGPTDDLVGSGWFEGHIGHFSSLTIAGDSDRWNGFVTRLSTGPAALRTVSPAAGRPGQTVTLTGSRLTGVRQVLFNGTAASSFTIQSASSLRAVVPPNAGSGPVSIATSAGPVTGPAFQVQALSTLAANHSAVPLAWPLPAHTTEPLYLALAAPMTTYSLRTALGALVGTGSVSTTSPTLSTTGLAPGLYFLTLNYPLLPARTTRIVLE